MDFTRQLKREEWKVYFDTHAQLLSGTSVDIEGMTEELGHQIIVQSLRLTGITYEAVSDTLHIICERFDHAVDRPVAIYVEEEGVFLKCIGVVETNGETKLVRFKESLRLGRA